MCSSSAIGLTIFFVYDFFSTKKFIEECSLWLIAESSDKIYIYYGNWKSSILLGFFIIIIILIDRWELNLLMQMPGLVSYMQIVIVIIIIFVFVIIIIIIIIIVIIILKIQILSTFYIANRNIFFNFDIIMQNKLYHNYYRYMKFIYLHCGEETNLRDLRS